MAVPSMHCRIARMRLSWLGRVLQSCPPQLRALLQRPSCRADWRQAVLSDLEALQMCRPQLQELPPPRDTVQA
eukprot:15019270-Alexandrium_andersonii.AAC.1